MNISTRKRNMAKTIGRITLVLAVAVAALTSAVNDVNSLRQMATGTRLFTAEWMDACVVTAHAKTIPVSDSSCLETNPARVNRTGEFRWTGRVASGKAIEINGINGDINAEPAGGDEIEVVANKKGRNSDPDTVKIQVVEHAGGVTICAVYPSNDPERSPQCGPRSAANQHHSGTVELKDNDVRVDFAIRVPAGVEFLGRTVNGKITAKSLISNVESRTVNGSINISTTGYAQAKTVNGEISATLGNSNWPGSLEFKTVNGEISVNLPSTLNTEVNADTFSGGVSLGFPLASSRLSSPKHVSGTIGVGGRSLILKTFNGSINLRPN